ncbi:cytochrome D ubiquinol oxidase subunit II [Bacteroidia bacterium]|nr:cytochrome D ubiquinol oxidase subunit II [Bacteroidia bacterium]GHV20661.1 cytochrome D ubiquinol oxidase subunit II [Bacteroidia bacterium]
MDYSFYQHYWWFLISLLGALLVFLLFVQGGQSLIYSLGKKEQHLNMMLLSLKMKWELTFTTLVTFGGAFFASFPLFYSTSFGGAYWVWMLILFSFVVQAVSYEFISKKGNLLGNKTYKVFLFLNGLLGPVLLGAAVSTFFTGSEFIVNKGNITGVAMPVISSWQNPLHGLEAVGNLWNVALGLAIFFLARSLGCLHFINNLEDKEIRKNSRKQLLYNAIGFLLFFLPYLVMLLLKDGWVEDTATGMISMEPLKYWNNLLGMPWALFLLLAGVVLVLYGFVRGAFQEKFIYGIWYAGLGTILVVLVLFLIAGFNHTAYYPSLVDANSSLTISNSSSSLFTLKAMSVVSLFIPFVLAYIWYVWRSLDKKKIQPSDVSEDNGY